MWVPQAACGGFDAEMHEAEAEPVPNIDEHDTGNQLCVVEYIEDIYSFYRKTEVQSCVPADYMSRQADINEKMRAILIDWLIEVISSSCKFLMYSPEFPRCYRVSWFSVIKTPKAKHDLF